MRQALIEQATGTVVNIIELADGATWAPPSGHVLVASDVAGPGWRYDGNAFAAPEDANNDGVPDDPGPPTVAELLAFAAQERRSLTNGSAIINLGGRSISTWVDPESRGAITGLVVASQIVPNLTAPWKGAGGAFEMLTSAEITALALGMMSYVQACFAIEAALGAGIRATPATITAYEEITAAAWPASA